MKKLLTASVILTSIGMQAQIGIGTTTPHHDIQVRKNIAIGGTASDRWSELIMNPTYSGARQYAILVDGGLKEVYHYSIDATTDGTLGTSNANIFMRLSLNAPANSFRMNATGDIGMGVTPSTSYKLYVGGALRANGTVYSNSTALTSDARLKTDVQTVITGGEIISSLRPVHYYKQDGDNTVEGHSEFGFIAQEVREILPELVRGEETDSTYLSLDYNSFIAILTAATQEQDARITALEEALNEQIALNESLTRKGTGAPTHYAYIGGALAFVSLAGAGWFVRDHKKQNNS